MQLFINKGKKCYVSWRKGVRLRGHDNRNFSWIMGYFELWRNKHVSLQAAGGGSHSSSSSNDNPSPIVPRGMAIRSSEQLLLQSRSLTSECKSLSFQMRICFIYLWKVDFTLPTWYLSVVTHVQPSPHGVLGECWKVLRVGRTKFGVTGIWRW